MTVSETVQALTNAHQWYTRQKVYHPIYMMELAIYASRYSIVFRAALREPCSKKQQRKLRRNRLQAVRLQLKALKHLSAIGVCQGIPLNTIRNYLVGWARNLSEIYIFGQELLKTFILMPSLAVREIFRQPFVEASEVFIVSRSEKVTVASADFALVAKATDQKAKDQKTD